ncbi:MAG: hypothetical protein P8J61_08240 [Gammaproteobacteria bacterium]|nr:hypothetical protein [Gammaproteobacteria bacterium]
MVELVEFPQRQHQEFRKLVFKSVFDAAQFQEIDLEAYISSIYYASENPPIFSSQKTMIKIYLRFRDLVETTVSSDPDVKTLSDYNKVYLCVRVYLHNICMERQSMPDSDTELYLQDALKEYFQAGAKIFSLREESKILSYIKRMRKRALTQPGA